MPAEVLLWVDYVSPYAFVAKAAAYWTVANYREGHGLFAVSGMLFNHESPFRPEQFVTQKIVRGAGRIARNVRIPGFRPTQNGGQSSENGRPAAM